MGLCSELSRIGEMAKRQRSLRDHYFARSRDARDVDVVEILSSASETSCGLETADSGTDRSPPSDVEIAQSLWKEQWCI